MTQLFPIAAITDEFSQDIEAAVRSMAEIGMGGAELRMVFGKNVIDLTDAELDHAREIVGRHGLEIVSIASPLLKCILPDAPAVDARFQQDVFAATHTFEDQPRLADRALEIAERTGARIVRVFSYWRSVRPEACFERVARALEQLAGQAALHGRTIGLENEHACNIATGAETARVLEAVAHPNLKVVWDPANAYVSGETPYPDGYRRLPVERIAARKEEGLVADDTPAGGSAKLVLNQLRRALGECIARGELVVAHELPQRAVVLICPGLGGHHDVHRIAPILRAETGGLHAKLRDSVHIGNRDGAFVHAPIGIEPVQGKLRLSALGASALDIRAALRSPLSARLAQVLHARDQAHQLHRIAPVEREVADLLLLDHTFDGGFFGLDQFGGGLHRHLFLHVADLENGGKPAPFADVQHQPFQLPGFESLQGNHHGIRPDWQGQDFEAAGSIRGNCFRESRVQVLNCDLRSHNCRSSAVRDDAENGAFIGDLPRYNSY